MLAAQVEGAMTAGGASQPDPPALRPLGVGETVDAALKLYRNNATTLWKIVAVVIVPIEVIEVILRRLALPSDVFVHNGALYSFNGAGSTNAGSTVALLVVALLGLLGELLATGAVFKLQLDAYLGQPHDISESFAFARGKILSLLWLGIVATVLIALGLILFVIPGIWLMVASSVAVPALMLEGVKGFRAVRRSISLVRRRWWATLGRLLLAVVLYAVAAFLIGVIAGAINRGINVTSVTLFLVINGIISAILVILLSPFIAAVINVIYIDLRVRKEALDIELLASSFSGPAGPPQQPTGDFAQPSSSGFSPPPDQTSPAPPSASTPPPGWSPSE
jgi:hypothetical protein